MHKYDMGKIIGSFVFILAISIGIYHFGGQSKISFERALADQPACAEQTPYGRPATGRTDTIFLCRKAYAVEYDGRAKVPVWVAYDLAVSHVIGCLPRSNNFHADPDVPADQRAEKSDYLHSGYDIGHQASDADMAWDGAVQDESFLLTNMAPQLPALNRGVWRVLEVNTRAWAYGMQTDIEVYVGPIYAAADARIGHGVVVPHAFYKILINRRDSSSIAFIMPNDSSVFNDIRAFQVSVAEVEKQTGVQFPVPGDKTTVQTLWPPFIRGFDKAHKATCSAQSS